MKLRINQHMRQHLLGMAHVPEGRRIFRTLTVKENLLMGAFSVKR